MQRLALDLFSELVTVNPDSLTQADEIATSNDCGDFFTTKAFWFELNSRIGYQYASENPDNALPLRAGLLAALAFLVVGAAGQ